MIPLRWMFRQLSTAGLRARDALLLAVLRYGAVSVALPLCSSACFLALRIALSTLGVQV